MNTKYWLRELEDTILKTSQTFSVIVLTGPRQSGKTTLLTHLFGNTHNYVTLDAPENRLLANNDPKLFLERYPAPVLIDEIQYAPHLLSYIKIQVDKHRHSKGQFLLTGSQQFSMMKGVSESLAGRAAILSLLPMSWHESKIKADTLSLVNGWIRGGFPEPVVSPQIDKGLWYSSYLQTYLERDVRTLRQIGDLGEFQTFLQAIAARNGQIVKLSEISRDLGIAVNTVKAWISILEASQQIYLVRPYFKNKGKRLIKSPKLYFIDTGLYTHLIGLADPGHALSGPSAGALVETAVFGELMRGFINKGQIPRIYFWRTSAGEEVDFIIEKGEEIIPIEVKATKTPSPALAKSLTNFCKLFDDEVKCAYLVCLADEESPLAPKVSSVPFSTSSQIVRGAKQPAHK